MLRKTACARANFEAWPWPAKLPLKSHWYRHLSGGAEGSISREVRGVQTIGDGAVCLTLAFIAYRLYQHTTSGAYKTRLQHTTCMPPAIVAQDFSFTDPASNRVLTRAQLDEYRAAFAAHRAAGEPIESIVFKF